MSNAAIAQALQALGFQSENGQSHVANIDHAGSKFDGMQIVVTGEWGANITADIYVRGKDAPEKTVVLYFARYCMPDDNERDAYAFDDCEFSITDPFTTTCGRFTVDPENEYGIPALLAELLERLNRISESKPDPEALERLSDELQAYCRANRLPYLSADELALELRQLIAANTAHVAYLDAFVARWDAAQAAADGRFTPL